MFKIATWNINSIRSRINAVQKFLEIEKPDILLLQETKCENHQFPESDFAHLPYNIKIHGQKSYNGVAIFSKLQIDEVKTDFPNNPCKDQARFIEITCDTNIGYARIISVYVPNGGEVNSDKFELKLQFFDELIKYLESLKNIDENIIIGGDFNVAPFDIDVYSTKDLENSTCFTLIEKQKMRMLLNSGYQDLYRLHYPIKQEFSWWDYRGGSLQKDHGLRIDMILANNKAISHLSDCYINKSVRLEEKASDHAPVIAIF